MMLNVIITSVTKLPYS